MRRWCRARTSLRRSLHVFVVYVVAAGFLYRSLHTLQSAATRSRPTPPGNPATDTFSGPGFACSSAADVLFPAARRRYVAVVAGRSPTAVAIVTSLLRRGYGVVLISATSSALFSEKDALRVLPHAARLRVVAGTSECRHDVVTRALKAHDVTTAHLVYDETDFSQLYSAEQVGSSLLCCVTALEAAHRLNVSLNVVVKQRRTKPRLRRYAGHWHATQPAALAPPSRHGPNCNIIYDRTAFHDVFLKSLHMYVNVYRQLHNLTATFVVI